MYDSDHPAGEQTTLFPFWVGIALSAPAPKKTDLAVEENKAKNFLGSLKRQRRQLWDRTRPEVQQWYQQFLYMGFDEAVGTCSHCVCQGGQLGETGHRKSGFIIGS